MKHLKDHLIPLPVRGEPDTYGIRFADRLYSGSKADCQAEVDAIREAARRLLGDSLLADAREQEYRETWAPMLTRKALPKYVNVPDWARAMHDAAEASDAVA